MLFVGSWEQRGAGWGIVIDDNLIMREPLKSLKAAATSGVSDDNFKGDDVWAPVGAGIIDIFV